MGLLTEHFAYKLKKPVRHPLIDLRSLGARRRNCLVEVRLNRRLARDVYLGIEPLTFAADGGGLRLARDGSIVEWLVAMRRLPETSMLDWALRNGGPERAELDRLAHTLVRFYQMLAPERIEPATRGDRFAQEIGLCLRELNRPEFRLDAARIEGLVGRLTDFPRARPEMLLDRHREGRIIEGHGDLRPEHICLEREPVIIDCLEFSRKLRIVDPVDELAFLALECAMLGEAGVGERLQRSYETVTGDRPPEQLIAWYAGFRSLLRARLMALHSLEPGSHAPHEWLVKSSRYLETGLDYTEALT